MNSIKGNKAIESLFNNLKADKVATRSHGSVRVGKRQDGVKVESGNFDALLGIRGSKKLANGLNAGGDF